MPSGTVSRHSVSVLAVVLAVVAAAADVEAGVAENINWTFWEVNPVSYVGKKHTHHSL